jgi:hypothetical protein
MHIIQTVTAIHDRFLAGIFNSHPSVTEVYHWTRAVALFNRKLSSPVQPQDRDALWATAALLGIVAFSCDATTVEEAWPLKDPESSDMEWLRMSEGKASVWVIADPMRPDSVFYPLAEEFARFEREYAISASIQSGKQCLSGIPSAFVKLFELDDMERVEMNPYYYAVHIVVDVLHKKCDQSTIVRFLSFISHMQQEFKKLLGQKDPKALLLLAYWYAKMYTIWWMQRRAILECQAICQYLERHYGNDVTLLELLQFPKMTMSAFVGS